MTKRKLDYCKRFAVYVLLLIGICACSKPHTKPNKIESTPKSINENAICIDNNSCTIELPKGYVNMTESDIFKIIAEANTHILFLAFTDTIKRTSTFSVSKYSADEPMTIDSAFNYTVNSVATTCGTQMADSYKLIDSGTYQLEGKMMRFKISTIDKMSINIMYYFMKDDYSNELYEIKLITPKDKLKEGKKYIEKVALSFSFM